MSALEEYIAEHKKRISEDTVIILNNPYKYRIDISHPLIIPHYERFKKWKSIGRWPISDEMRHEFESFMFVEIKKGNLPG